MKLAFVDPESKSAKGGGVRTYLNWVSALCRNNGIDVTIFTLNPEFFPSVHVKPILRSPCLPRGIRSVAYRIAYSEIVVFEQSKWLCSQLTRDEYDCVEFADYQGLAYFSLRNLTLKENIILRVHTPLYLIYSHSGLGIGFCFVLLKWREKKCLQMARIISAPSGEFVQEQLAWISKYHVIPNPPPSIGIVTILPETTEPAEPANFHIVFLGRLEPRKGPEILLQAFLIIAEKFPTVTLNFYGDAPIPEYAESMQSLVQKTPLSVQTRIHWNLHKMGDKNVWLKNYSCMVVPSLWENSPYVFWEGIAAGLPTLGTDTGEMKHSRIMTMAPIIKPGDTISLAKALIQLIEFPDTQKVLIQKQQNYLSSLKIVSETLPNFYLRCAKSNSSLA